MPGVGPECGKKSGSLGGGERAGDQLQTKIFVAGVIQEVKARLLARAAKGGLWEDVGTCKSWSYLDRKIFRL